MNKYYEVKSFIANSLNLMLVYVIFMTGTTMCWYYEDIYWLTRYEHEAAMKLGCNTTRTRGSMYVFSEH